MAQEAINRLMIREARRGQRRGPAEGRRSLRARAGRRGGAGAGRGRHPLRGHPRALSSAVAGPALAGIPVTHRGPGLGVRGALGARRRPPTGRCSTACRPAGVTVVVLMGYAARADIAARLLARGFAADTPGRAGGRGRHAARPGAGWAALDRAGRGAGARPIAWPPGAPVLLVVGAVVTLAADAGARGGRRGGRQPSRAAGWRVTAAAVRSPATSRGRRRRGARGLQVEGLTKRFTRDAPPAVDDVSFQAPAGSHDHPAGPVGLGQVDGAAPDGRPGVPRRRAHPGRRRRRHRTSRRSAAGWASCSRATPCSPTWTCAQNIAFGLAESGKLSRGPRSIAGSTSCWRRWSCRATAAACRASCRAGSASGWRSPGRWPPSRACCCWTSRSGRWTRRCGCRCASGCAGSTSTRQRDRGNHPPVTTILVTHDQEEAMELSDTIVVMNQGRVEQIGSPSEIYDRPATPFVARVRGRGQRAARAGEQRPGDGRARWRRWCRRPPGASDGAEVHAFVRPHEVRLTKVREPARQTATAAAEAAGRGAGPGRAAGLRGRVREGDPAPARRGDADGGAGQAASSRPWASRRATG